MKKILLLAMCLFGVLMAGDEKYTGDRGDGCFNFKRRANIEKSPDNPFDVIRKKIEKNEQAFDAIDSWINVLKVPELQGAGRANALFKLGLEYAIQNKLTDAIDSWINALKITEYKWEDKARVLLCIGMAQHTQGKSFEAILSYKTALFIPEIKGLDKAKALVNLGEICFRQGLLSDSILSWTDALKIPEYKWEDKAANVFLCLGIAHGKQGKSFEAISFYETALLIPELKGLYRAKALMNLASECYKQGKHDDVVKSYKP